MTSPTGSPTRTLTTRDLLAIRMADDPQISPDGAQVAWVHTWIDAAANEYRSQICLTDLHGAGTRLLTAGLGLDTHPRWSPDGTRLAFLSTWPSQGGAGGSDGSDRSGESVRSARSSPQLCLVDPASGHTTALTALPYGVQQPAWSPDGTAIAFTTRIAPDEDFAQPGVQDDSQAEDPYARYNRDVLIVRRRKWKMDGEGHFGPLRQAVARVEVGPEANTEAGGGLLQSPTFLAVGDSDFLAPTWAPDGAWLAVMSNLDATADATRRQYVYLLDTRAHEPAPPRKLGGLEDIRHPGLAWAPDGRALALAGHDDPQVGHYGDQRLWLLAAPGGELRCVTAPFTGTLGNAAYTDVGRYGGDAGVRFLPDGRHVLALVSSRGAVHLAQIDTTSGAVMPLTAGDLTVTAFTLDASGTRLALQVRAPAIPGDIFVLDLAAPATPMRRLTDVNRDLLGDVRLAPPQKFQFEAGGATIDAWLLAPPDRPHDRRCPVVLFTGGGPGGMRAANFLFEHQILAAAGYAVLFCNAHGCQAYGEEFCTSILGAWGERDFADNMRCLDVALAQFDFVDPQRLAIAGGSYGGYLVNWALGHTDRFRAAVADRSVFNRFSSYGTSDIGHLREFEFAGGPPWVTPDAYLRHSPLVHIGAARTPTLVIHSAQDLRCPVEQGEQLYLALRWLGVPTELVRFPNEGHELSRSGRPWHRVFRLDRYLDWFARHL
jgi:dipeptidyl aminopeptidase/acylaminoacyl peptidase